MRASLALLFLWIPAFGDTGTRFDWIRKLGSGQDFYTGLATDSQGNTYVVGSTRAPDFPLKSPVQPTLASASASDVFVVKLDRSGDVVYSTCFGGTGEDVASALAVDALGNLYVSGQTFSSDFPVTRGAFLSTLPPAGPLQLRGASFVFKLNADGTIGYSTFFSSAESNPKAIAVDRAGSVYLGGPTSGGLPVTPGAYQSVCNCGFGSNGFFSVPSSDGFLAHLDAAGTKLLYATYLGVNVSLGGTIGTPIAVAPDGSAYVGASSGVYWVNPAGSALLAHAVPKVRVQAMALAPDGSLYVAGGALAGTDGFQPTAGAAQTDRNTFPRLDYQYVVDEQSAVVKLDGQLRTLAATYFGGPYFTAIRSLALDGSGSLLIGGTTAPHGLPTLSPIALGFGSPSTGFAAELSSDLSAVRFSSYFGDTENFPLQSVAAGADGRLVLGGATVDPSVTPSTGTVWVNQVTVAPPQPLRVDSVVNAASRLDDPISGGETIIIRGDGFDSDARLTIGGTEVNPIAATSREITAVAPAGLPAGAVTVNVQSRGSISNSVLIPVAAASPGLFAVDRSGRGQGLILNQDGERNGPDHPAQPGEQITIFATGVGSLTFDRGYAVTANPVSVFVDIFYCRGVAAILGPVDGLPGDVYQLTVYVPTYAELAAANPDLSNFKYPPQVGVVLRIAGQSSQNGLAISIAP